MSLCNVRLVLRPRHKHTTWLTISTNNWRSDGRSLASSPPMKVDVSPPLSRGTLQPWRTAQPPRRDRLLSHRRSWKWRTHKYRAQRTVFSASHSCRSELGRRHCCVSHLYSSTFSSLEVEPLAAADRPSVRLGVRLSELQHQERERVGQSVDDGSPTAVRRAAARPRCAVCHWRSVAGQWSVAPGVVLPTVLSTAASLSAASAADVAAASLEHDDRRLGASFRHL